MNQGVDATVPVGNDDVLVESKGFRRYEQTGIGIQVQQTVRVDVQLEIGELSNTVEVQASTAQLSVSNATVATVICRLPGFAAERAESVCAGDTDSGCCTRTRLNSVDQRRTECLR